MKGAMLGLTLQGNILPKGNITLGTCVLVHERHFHPDYACPCSAVQLQKPTLPTATSLMRPHKENGNAELFSTSSIRVDLPKLKDPKADDTLQNIHAFKNTMVRWYLKKVLTRTTQDSLWTTV